MGINYNPSKWENGKTVIKASHFEKIEKGITDIINYNNSIYTDEDKRKENEIKREEEHNKKIKEVNTLVDDLKSDYDSLEKIIIDENASANLQKQINNVNSQLAHIANKGTTVEVLERVTKEEIDRQISDGTIASLTLKDGTLGLEKFNKNLLKDNVSFTVTSEGVNRTYAVISLNLKDIELNVANNSLELDFMAVIDSFETGTKVNTPSVSQYDSLDPVQNKLTSTVIEDEELSNTKLFKKYNIKCLTNSEGQYLHLYIPIIARTLNIEYFTIKINGIDYSYCDFIISKGYGSHSTSVIEKNNTIINDKIALINDSGSAKDKTYSSDLIDNKFNSFSPTKGSLNLNHFHYGEYTNLNSYLLTNTSVLQSYPVLELILGNHNLYEQPLDFEIRFRLRVDEYKENTSYDVYRVTNTHNHDMATGDIKDIIVQKTENISKDKLYQDYKIKGNVLSGNKQLNLGLSVKTDKVYIECVSFVVNGKEYGLYLKHGNFFVYSANIEKLNLLNKKRLVTQEDLANTSLNLMTGTKIACFGDSITDESQYRVQLENLLRAEITNMGSSGGDHMRMWQIVQGNFEGKPLLDYTEYELVTIMIGTNFGPTSLEDISNFDILREQEGGYLNYPDTYCGCICKTIEYLMEKNPALRIMLLTSPKTTQRPIEQMEAIVTNMKQIGKRYGIPVIDVQNNCQVSKYNYEITMPDKVHPRGQGAVFIGRYVAKQILSNW